MDSPDSVEDSVKLLCSDLAIITKPIPTVPTNNTNATIPEANVAHHPFSDCFC